MAQPTKLKVTTDKLRNTQEVKTYLNLAMNFEYPTYETNTMRMVFVHWRRANEENEIIFAFGI